MSEVEITAPPATREMRCGTYVASRASLPERVEMWLRIRDVDGYIINSSWLDEAAPGASSSLPDLWLRVVSEIRRSERLILYAEQPDFPLKGALIEAGAALAAGIQVRVVLPAIVLDPVSWRPIGSWIRHPLVTVVDSIEEALDGACRSYAVCEHLSAEVRDRRAIDTDSANEEFSDVFRAAFIEMITLVSDSRVESADAAQESIMLHVRDLPVNDATKVFALLTAAYFGIGGRSDDASIGGRYQANDSAESLRRLADWIDTNRIASA